MNWIKRGLCAQTSPEDFYPDKGGSVREAKRICSACEVRVECLEYALTNDERFGVWGGLSERERHRLRTGQGAAEARVSRDYTEVDRLLRGGEHTDIEISRLCDVPKSSVYRRREQLDLAPMHRRRTPLAVYAERAQAAGDGHRIWIGSAQVAVQGRYYSPAQLAFLAGYGRQAEGRVKTTCGRDGCVASAHLADREMRRAIREGAAA